MDPNECLRRFFAALDRGDVDAAHEHAEDLRGWLYAGGFEPSWPRGWNRVRLLGWPND